MATWRYATPEEVEAFPELPSPYFVPVEEVFPVVSGTVVCRKGHELPIPDGKVLRLLEMDRGEAWCYQTKAVTVLMGEREVSLKPGTWVAIFSRR